MKAVKGCGIELVEIVEICGKTRYRVRASKNDTTILINVSASSAEEAIRKAVEIASKYLGPC